MTYQVITNADDLQKIFETAADKLIVLYFYTQNNMISRNVKTTIEFLSNSHQLSYFCAIDINNFEGDSKYVNSVTSIPRLDFYNKGNHIGSSSSTNSKEIKMLIENAERYIMNSGMNQGYGMQMNPMQQQIQQQLLVQMQMSNPYMYDYYVKNPMALQQAAQTQLFKNQQMYQNQMPQMQQQMQNMQPQMQQVPSMIQNTPLVTAPTSPQTSNAAALGLMALQATSGDSDAPLPTIQQMQQMFKIFQMMQQMGLINQESNVQQSNIQQEQDSNDISSIIKNLAEGQLYTLPDGKQIVKMAGDKYGIVKKN